MVCKRCGKQLENHELKKEWNEKGSWYSVKIGYCPECGEAVIVIKYSNETELDINNDIRYYR